MVSTDHCPFCFKEQKELGRGDFSKIPNGMPGVEHRMDLLHQAVVDGQITLARWVEVACDHAGPDVRPVPAQGRHRAGRRRRHRDLRPGGDADACRRATHHMNMDYSAYEGMEITGQVRHRALPRPVVIDDGPVRRAAPATASS